MGYVTRVKDQGDCGSCWTFASAGALEGQYKRATGKLVSFSEQNLVDCVYAPQTGCSGGNAFSAFEYTIKNNGIESEMTYPYMGKWSGKCKNNPDANIKIGTTRYSYANSEEDIKAAVATIGPVYICNFLFNY